MRALLAAALVALLAAGTARAQVELVSPETVHGVADLRLVAADGEASFADGGFGKTRYGGTDDGGWRVRGDVAELGLEWAPRFGWEWSALVDAVWQPGQEHAADLLQAYVLYKPVPRSDTRFQARLGFFYPPVSLEHDAPFWGMTDMITPSAINSWIGEEVKVVGGEGQVEHRFGGQSLAATAGLFAYDDTAGTLLTYRGWGLDDLKATAFGSFYLPPFSPFAAQVQDNETYSTLELDGRVGWYAKLQWRPSGDLSLEALRYDNRGDRTSVNDDLQWAWSTSFTDLGLDWRIDSRTRLLAQAMAGRTRYGLPTPLGLFADVTFRAAYVRLSRDALGGTVSGRLDAFQVVENSFDDNAEHGWAVTGAWRRPLSRHVDLRLEALHVWSDRPSRLFGGLAPHQAQTVLQSSLRASF